LVVLVLDLPKSFTQFQVMTEKGHRQAETSKKYANRPVFDWNSLTLHLSA